MAKSPDQLRKQLDKAKAAQPPPDERRKKTECPLTLSQFLALAKPFRVNIDGTDVVVSVKEFSTGSFGWNANAKVSVDLSEDVSVTVQVGLNLTVVGSKEAPRE